MTDMDRRTALKVTALGVGSLVLTPEWLSAQDAAPFGKEFPNLESLTTGTWWNKPAAGTPKAGAKKQGNAQPAPPSMDVPRNEVVAFAIYTHHAAC